MYDPRYSLRNPFYLPPPPVVDAASPATPLFRFVTAIATPSTARAAAPGNPNSAADSRNQRIGAHLADERPRVLGLSRGRFSD